MDRIVVIEGEVSLTSLIDGDTLLSDNLDGESGVFYEVSAQEHETYHGAYEFTPNDETQIIEIADMIAMDNIVINPVPNNYGHIYWNGAVLTVS